MTTGAADIWIWGALASGAVAIVALVTSIVMHRRGDAAREETIANVVAGVAAAGAALSLFLLFT